MAFPRAGVAGLAWLAPGLLLFTGVGTSTRAAFRLGYLGGMAYYLATLYWLLYIPVKFLPIIGWIGLSAYLSLYPALWVWLSWKFFPALSTPRGETAAPASIIATSAIARAFWALQSAALWVALEMVLARFLSGFPWDLLGVSQYKMLPVIQIASVTGVYGVSFLIIWFSTSLMLTALAIYFNAGKMHLWGRDIALPLFVVTVIAAFGFRNSRQTPQAPRQTVKAALIQPSIPQTLIWDERENEHRFQQLIALSEKALAENPDLLVWPEASVPNMLRHHEPTARAVIDLVRRYRVWAIIGSDDAEYRKGGGPREIDYFNSAFAVSPAGELSGAYKKRRLVLFGEYVPFTKWLPFMKMISPAGESGFTPGTEAIPFRLDSLGVVASILICFEDTFPHLARDYVKADTDFLINLTNNGWFGESAAQWQHAATAVFRAVENRVPLIRCANNGLTCWVDEVGRMHDVYFPDSEDVYRAGYKIVEVPALPDGVTRELSFYTRHGDVFGWICTALAALKSAPFFIGWVRQRRLGKSAGNSSQIAV